MAQPGPAPVREGDLLAGKYRVERVLGSGGMGIVVAARHEQLGQLVAIKFVREEAIGNDEAIERFLREARSAVKLKSEHVARVLDVGTLDSGAPYMVMEFLDGSDLGEVLQGQGPMTVEGAVQLIIQACEAVAEAHAAGIVHRDLKPQNLFLTRTINGSPRLKVLDFGVSKTFGLTREGIGALTQTRAMLGSPLYMAPEQMRSARDVNATADIWALGVVLFELLTRRWPFEAESMPELCLKVVTEPPQALRALRPDVSPELVAVIERCLEKESTKRFAHAGELAIALEPFAPAPSRSRSQSRAAFASYASFVPPQTTLASGNTPKAQLAGRVVGPDTPTLATPHTPTKPTSTAAAWGPTPTGAPIAPKASKLGGVKVWGTALVAAAILLVLLVSSRRDRPAAEAAAPPTPVTLPAPSIAAATVLPPAPPLPVPSAADTAASSASPAIEDTPGAPAHAEPSASTHHAAAPVIQAQLPRPQSSKPVSSARPMAKQGPGDDDIPSLR